MFETGKFTHGKRDGAWKQSSEDGKTNNTVKYKEGAVLSGTPMQPKPNPAPAPAQNPGAPAPAQNKGTPAGQPAPKPH